MARRREIESGAALPTIVEGDQETKAQLQRRMDEARESISQTVDEIKGTVEDQYATVKATVSGILDWREKFQSEPIVWSVAALAAGFALGHTVGAAQKRKRPSAKRSPVEVFADTLKEEIATIGKTLPMSSLDASVKRVLGFELSDLFAEIGGGKGGGKATRAARRNGARQPRSRGRGRPPSRRPRKESTRIK